MRNGFTEVRQNKEVWSWQRPALLTAIAGTFVGYIGQGLVVFGTSILEVVSTGGTSYIGSWVPLSTSGFSVSTANAVPGFVAVLGSSLYKIAIETQVVYKSTLAPTLLFTTSGTTTQYSDNNKADFTQTTNYIVAGMGFTGVYDYVASTDGLAWEPVDVGAFSVRNGNIVGYGTGVYRFSGDFNTIDSSNAYYTYYTKGTSTTGWDRVSGTQASAFGTFNINNPCLSTANGRIWALGTATWTGGTSVLAVSGTGASGGLFTWNLVGTLPSAPYGITFQKRFSWSAAANKAAVISGTGNPGSIIMIGITPTGTVSTLGTTVVLTNPNLGANAGGTLTFLNSPVQIARFDLGGNITGGFSP